MKSAATDNSSSLSASTARAGRALTNGAFVLGGLGTYVLVQPGRIVIGHRAGPLHYAITAVVWCIALAVGCLFWPYSRAVAALPSLVMGVPLALTLVNRQQWELTPRALRMSGSALGKRTRRDYRLRPEASVRLVDYYFRNKRHPIWQMQVQADSGEWIGVAESCDHSLIQALADEIRLQLQIPFPGSG